MSTFNWYQSCWCESDHTWYSVSLFVHIATSDVVSHSLSGEVDYIYDDHDDANIYSLFEHEIHIWKNFMLFLIAKNSELLNAQRPSMTQVLVLVCPSSTISSDRVDAPPCQQDSRDGSPNQQSRHEICQKFYTAGFLGQTIYTLIFNEFQQFWW